MDEFSSNFLRLLLFVAFGGVLYCLKKGYCCKCFCGDSDSEATNEARSANGFEVSSHLEVHNSSRVVEMTNLYTDRDENDHVFVPLSVSNDYDLPRIVTTSPSAERLDLPPSYDDYLSRSRSASRHDLPGASSESDGRILNSNCDEGDSGLLPSYEEALVNIVLSGPSDSSSSDSVS